MKVIAHVLCWALLGQGGATLATAALVTPARAPEITGVYDDEGTVALPPPAGVQVFPSLHAFLSGEFSPGMAKLVHEKTRQLRLTHANGRLEAEATDHDGEAIWNFEWKSGDTFGVRGERVVVLFRGAKVNDDQYRLLIETVSTYKLLQIEVQRLRPSTFGLQVQPMGTYLFSRAE